MRLTGNMYLYILSKLVSHKTLYYIFMKHPAITILFSILFCLFLLSLSCKDEPTKPTLEEPPKSPRDYTWTIDTITYPGSWQTNMQSIWGSSASDIYIVGHNDQPGPATMFHYNGTNWSTTNFHSASGGTISGAVSLEDVYGFGSNDVWVIGTRYQTDNSDSSFIMHYNGNQWIEQQIQRGRTLQTVWGISSNDVWAGGLEGTLFHYNGAQWQKVTIPFKGWFAEIEGTTSNDIYGITYHYSPGIYDTTVWSLLHWDGNSWTTQIQFNEDYYTPDKFGTYSIHYISGTYYSAGRGYYKKVGSTWDRIYYNENRPVFLDFAAIGESDVFVVGDRGLVYHYNGGDWYQFTQFNSINIMFGGCWRTERDVFIVGHNGNKTVVLHGK
jgi:hypothetical protein